MNINSLEREYDKLDNIDVLELDIKTVEEIVARKFQIMEILQIHYSEVDEGSNDCGSSGISIG